MILLVLLLLVGADKAFADSLQNGAYKQRIGNYEVEMTTDPKNPVVGASTSILLRIAGVNGDDLVDVPMTIRVVKDGVEIQRTNPIIVPYGHYTYQFVFEEGGKYTIYVDIDDYFYSGETLTFTFFTSIAGTYDYLYVVAPSAAVLAVAAVGALTLMKKRRNNKKKQTAAEQN